MTEDRWDEVREMYAEDETDHVLGRLVNWFGTYISVMNRLDLVLLALWVVHTHLAKELRTTPRLQLDCRCRVRQDHRSRTPPAPVPQADSDVDSVIGRAALGCWKKDSAPF